MRTWDGWLVDGVEELEEPWLIAVCFDWLRYTTNVMLSMCTGRAPSVLLSDETMMKSIWLRLLRS